MHDTNEVVFTLIDDEPVFDIDPQQLLSLTGQLISRQVGIETRKALNAALGRLDDGDDDPVVIKSQDSPDDLAHLNALCAAAAAGWRVAVEAMQAYIRQHGPGESLGNENIARLARLVDASLAPSLPEQCAEQIRRIQAGEVAARSLSGMRPLNDGQMMRYRNHFNQRAEQNKPATVAY